MSDEWIIQCLTDQRIKSMNQWIWMNTRMNGVTNEWIKEWMNENDTTWMKHQS